LLRALCLRHNPEYLNRYAADCLRRSGCQERLSSARRELLELNHQAQRIVHGFLGSEGPRHVRRQQNEVGSLTITPSILSLNSVSEELPEVIFRAQVITFAVS